MASVINLTLPIAPESPVGQIWPFDVPFQMEPIRSYGSGGAQLEYYQLSTETGTRLVTRARHDASAPALGALDFGALVDRPAVVIDIPKGAGEVIEEAELSRALAAADPAAEDAVLIRTGWGSEARSHNLKHDFVLTAPTLSPAAVAHLAEHLGRRLNALLLIDTPLLAGRGTSFAVPEWLSLAPWLRPPWPSEIARAYLKHYTPEKAAADFGADRLLLDAADIVLCLANTDAIRTRRVRITALPLFVEQAPSAPATVIAKAA